MAYGVDPKYNNHAILAKLAALSDKDLLARLLFGECRGEILAGQVAVANVVLNRVKDGRFGHNVKEVCLKKWQFSCFNEDDPNLPLTASPPMREPFTQCELVAELALSYLLHDNTGGATHYANLDVCYPKWIKSPKMQHLCKIGRHTFYKELR